MVNISLEAPSSWLVDHTEGVVLSLAYGAEAPSTTEFSRADLAQGVASKPFFVRTDAAVTACTFTWQLQAKATGAAATTRQLLRPAGFDGIYHGTCNVGASDIVLELPWVMSTVTIDLPAAALDAHQARSVLGGELEVAGATPKFSIGFATGAATWSVDVLADRGVERTASLKWLLRAGTVATTTSTTTDDHLVIE
jgi:hypothetical protein